ncbi:MAG TPA: 23S rRNA (guanosine(2251)-2'-O)-methyltransferase RlmB [Acidimicrobiia bacterium]|nr:23S rRNA (guanosine(2251)-2'-O)-methyltransferase RlmB [Acidimicrobiia bacterium]
MTAPAGIGDRVEGLHAVAAAAAAGRVTHLIVERQRLRHDNYRSLTALAEQRGATVQQVEDAREDAITEAPQGVIATCRPIRSVSLDDAMRAADPAALVVLDRIQDPRNVGAMARTALAAGIPALVVPERRAAPVGATAFKAAAGALEVVKVAVVGSVADALRRLRKAGVWLVGLDGAAETSLLGLPLLTEPVALVIGAEGTGVSRLAGDLLDQTVRIPMVGDIESLNASVAASLAMFEIARVRGWIS